MAQATASSTTVKDATGVTKTLSQVTDPNNSSYLAPKVLVDESLNTKATYAVGASLFTLTKLENSIYQDLVVAVPTNAVPEPETYAMLLAGLGVVGLMARRRLPR